MLYSMLASLCGLLQASGAGDGLIRMWGIEDGGGGHRALKSIGSLPARGFLNGLAIAKSGKFLVAAMGQEPRLGRWQGSEERGAIPSTRALSTCMLLILRLLRHCVKTPERHSRQLGKPLAPPIHSVRTCPRPRIVKSTWRTQPLTTPRTSQNRTQRYSSNGRAGPVLHFQPSAAARAGCSAGCCILHLVSMHTFITDM